MNRRCDWRDITRSEKSGRVSVKRCKRESAADAEEQVGWLGAWYCDRHAAARAADLGVTLTHDAPHD